jgi:phosphoserine phosphatase RsbX
LAEDGRPRLLEWGAATRARPGEPEGGDLAVVTSTASGTLVAAFDGSGHGLEAARAARAGAGVVREHGTEDLFALVVRCHEALRSTRGAALSIAFFAAGTSEMTWLGIGNVEGRVFGGDGADPRPKGALRLAAGVVGHELATVTRETLELRRGDVMVFATDGIGASFADGLSLRGPPQEIAERILDEHWKPTDDGLVLVVRHLGGGR